MRKICFGFCLLFVFASVATAVIPEIVSVKKIWDIDKYHCFTDLKRFKGKWYCTFRESDSHVGGEQGKIRVIVSKDTETWKSVNHIVLKGRDLRDPKISVTTDGRLMVYSAACLYEGRTRKNSKMQVTFSKNGVNWTPLQVMQFDCPGEHKTDGHQLWRLIWHKGRAYGVTKLMKPNRAMLVTSTDGVHWKQITKINIPNEADGSPAAPSEAALQILNDGNMMILFRQVWLGTSPPPFTEWTWHKVDQPPKEYAKDWAPKVPTIAGPELIQIPDGSIWATGRQYWLPLPPTNSEKRIVLASVDRTSYTPVLIIPSGGDCGGYAGMVWHDGYLWISYHSAEPGTTARADEPSSEFGKKHSPEIWVSEQQRRPDRMSLEHQPFWPNIYMAKIQFNEEK